MSKKRVAVFAGSFDPFTYGHQDVVANALLLFDEIIIAVGASGSKQAAFSVEERCSMISEIFTGRCEVKVKTFKGLVVHFAVKESAMALIRGLRTEADFSYEMPMAVTNRRLNDSLPTVFFPTSTTYSYLSSSLVREVAMNGGDVAPFVPPAVLARVREKFPPF